MGPHVLCFDGDLVDWRWIPCLGGRDALQVLEPLPDGAEGRGIWYQAIQ